MDLKTFLETTEKNFISVALQANSNNVTRAAATLGIKRTTLVEKLRKYGNLVNSPALAVDDPEGDFTYKKNGKVFDIFFKGEKIAHRGSLQAVASFIKEKIS